MLAEYTGRDANSFNLLRLMAAMAVLCSHSYLLIFGSERAEPLHGLMSYNLGQQAVNVFFVISGLTLAQSWEARPTLSNFLAARCLRILPGLLSAGIFVALVLGALLTHYSLADYLLDENTWLYPPSSVLFLNQAIPPPGLFENVPLARDINSPLWTIKYEIFAYISFAAASVFGFLGTTRRAAAATAFFVVAFILLEQHPELVAKIPPLGSISRFGVCFALGVLLYQCRAVVPTTGWWLLTIIPALGFGGAAGKLFTFVWAVSLVIVIGTRSFPKLSTWSRRTDVSYGTYLYGWPVQQALLSSQLVAQPLEHILLSISLVPLLGYLSWCFVEKPALAWKKKYLPGKSHVATVSY